MALTYRVIMGGTGVWSGVAGILVASTLAIAGHLILRGRTPRGFDILALGCGVASITVLTIAVLPSANAARALIQLAAPVAALNLVATLIAASVIAQTRRLSHERDLLRAAFTHAPDFHYVKNTRSQFAAVNEAVARHNGFARPDEMVGRTDFDITDPERAASLLAAEQEMLASGVPLVDKEEVLEDELGQERWWSTSKVPLHDRDGRTIGLAGVTRDISAQKRLEGELLASRNRLSYALAEMGDGLAMFASDGSLVFCNEQYRHSFPLTADVRRSGMHIKDILRAVAETGEQQGIPEDDVDGWINEVAAGLGILGEQEVHLFDGRWMHVKTRPTADGSSMVVVSDVSTIKEAEAALRILTDQLQLLAATDGMTGLLNRRSFDKAIETEIIRCARERQPLALLMIDVDRFKAYNDRYGHQAGDGCLRAVSRCLRETLKRPADLAARYGGEEFAAILPNTDEDGAYFIAEQFRKSLRALSLPHDGSEKGIVTASVGVAVNRVNDRARDSAELIGRADEALYAAKEAGRDRVNGWRQRSRIASAPA